MKDSAYAYGVGRIRAVENTLLTKSDIEQLISAKNINDAKRMLADKGYEFKNQRENLWTLLDEVSGEIDILKIFLYKNDYHNLKVIIKGLSSGKSFDDMLMSPVTVPVETIVEAVQKEKYENLPGIMAEAAKKAYELLNRHDDAKGACMMIDKASYEALLQGAKLSKNDFLIDIVKAMVDTTNVKIALRCSKISMGEAAIFKALTPGATLDIKNLSELAGRDFDALNEYLMTTFVAEGLGDFASFEKWCDDLIIKKLIKAKYKALGIEPILAYYFAKEAELKTLHIILHGKASDISEAAIRERVRELYV